jgi:hypothetical protein
VTNVDLIPLWLLKNLSAAFSTVFCSTAPLKSWTQKIKQQVLPGFPRRPFPLDLKCRCDDVIVQTAAAPNHHNR